MLKLFLNLLCLLIGVCLVNGTSVMTEPAQAKWNNLFKKGDGVLIFLKDESIKSLLKKSCGYFKVMAICSFVLFIISRLLHIYILDYFLSFVFMMSCFYYFAIYWIYQHKRALSEILLRNWMFWTIIAVMILSCVAEYSFYMKIPKELSLKVLFGLWQIPADRYWIGILFLFLMIFLVVYVGYWLIFLGLIVPLVLLVFIVQKFLKLIFRSYLEPFKAFLCLTDLFIGVMMNQFL